MAPCSALGGRKSKASFDHARVSVARILLLLGCMTVPRGVMSETSGIVSVGCSPLLPESCILEASLAAEARHSLVFQPGVDEMLQDVRETATLLRSLEPRGNLISAKPQRSLQSPERLTRENFAESNENFVRQLGRVALERNMDLDDLEAQLASYIDEHIKGNRRMITALVDHAQQKGANQEEVKVSMVSVLARGQDPRGLVRTMLGESFSLNTLKALFADLLSIQESESPDAYRTLAQVATKNSANVTQFKAALLSSVMTVNAMGDTRQVTDATNTIKVAES